MTDRKKMHDVEHLRSPQRLERMELDRVVDLCLEDITVSSVLDVGTGSGVFAEAFASSGLEVAGLDENAVMLEAARRHLPGLEFRQGSAESLPWPDRAYDLVFLGLVLHEVDSPLTVLREARRVARVRVAALEWPHTAQEFGPPLEDRLRTGDVIELGISAGFRRVEVVILSHFMLYLMGV